LRINAASICSTFLHPNTSQASSFRISTFQHFSSACNTSLSSSRSPSLSSPVARMRSPPPHHVSSAQLLTALPMCWARKT
jgi:hypothetical protein